MIGNDDWPFTVANRLAADFGIHITAVYGIARNEGSTDLALDSILEDFKEVSNMALLQASTLIKRL